MTAARLAALHRAGMTTGRPWSEVEIAEMLASEGVFVCEVEGGLALGRVAADEAELLTVAVDPEHRRCGKGAALLKAFEAAACAKGARRAFLEVAADNPAALALYRRVGWRECGRRPRYYGRGSEPAVDAVVMEKSIPHRPDDAS